MRQIDYSTLNDDLSIGYNDIIEQVKNAPNNQTKGLREFVGSLKIDCDPLEIQKEMRAEWD